MYDVGNSVLVFSSYLLLKSFLPELVTFYFNSYFQLHSVISFKHGVTVYGINKRIHFYRAKL